MKLTLVAVKVPDDIPEDEIDLFCCESCYFEDVCMQTEHVPSEIRQCETAGTVAWNGHESSKLKPFYWTLEEE